MSHLCIMIRKRQWYGMPSVNAPFACDAAVSVLAMKPADRAAQIGYRLLLQSPCAVLGVTQLPQQPGYAFVPGGPIVFHMYRTRVGIDLYGHDPGQLTEPMPHGAGTSTALQVVHMQEKGRHRHGFDTNEMQARPGQDENSLTRL